MLAVRIGATVAACLTCSCGRVGFGIAEQDAASAVDAVVDSAVDAADRPNRMFASTATPSASMVNGGDAICASEAARAGLSGTFVSVIYRDGRLPAGLLASRGFARLDGSPIADTLEQLAAGQGYSPIAERADGSYYWHVYPIYAWTGSPSEDCAAWTSTDSARQARGVQIGSRTPFGGVSSSCDVNYWQLVCSEVGHQVVLPAPTPQAGRLAFWNPAVFASPADADAQCQALANENGRAGTFLAAIGIDNRAASDRFDLTGAPWVNLAGQPLATTGAAFMALEWRNTLTAFGDAGVALVAVGAGSLTEPSSPATNCSNWTDHTDLGGQRVIVNPSNMFLSVGSTNCNMFNGSLCLQQ